MALKGDYYEVLKALRYGARERDELADQLLAAKVEVYADTLEDLAIQHGYELQGDLELSDEVLAALRDESRSHAGLIVDTYNGELRAFIERNADTPIPQLLDDFAAWADERGEAKAPEIAVTEAFTAHADATLAFYADNDLEPEFDFGGHGDAHAECELCQALEETGPHPLERVREIGNPHIQCRQHWRARVTPDQLPDELQLGRRPGGIVGGEPLTIKLGDLDTAVESVRSR